MNEKLEALKARFEQLGIALTNPDIVNNNGEFTRISKEYKKLEPIIEVYEKYLSCQEAIVFSKEVLSGERDEELRLMAKEELEEQLLAKEELEEKIRHLLIPKDPEDEKDVILEIRAGTGGDEAGIFAGDLMRMYLKLFERKGWQAAVLSDTPGTAGGYKEIQLEVKGKDVYGSLKFESGVHRVQRVPTTESSGRLHTSAATVAVLPEAEELDFELKDSDVKMETSRSGGAGGQNVNKVETKVMLTHILSGTVVICQTERTQLGNRTKAMQMMRTKLYEEKVREQEEAISSRRKSMVSTGDRSAKIRTYNYPQGRITDHRINKTIYSLDDFMNGHIDEMIEALQFAENAEKMKAGESI